MLRYSICFALASSALLVGSACGTEETDPGVTLAQLNAPDERFGASGHPAPSPAATEPLAELAEPIRFTSVSAGFEYTCATVSDGTVRCWGDNSYGQLGEVGASLVTKPVQVPNLHDVKQIAAARYHTCALLNNGTVRCWGDNTYGQLGDGTFTARLSPTVVMRSSRSALDEVTSIVTAESHTCALTKGRVRCWGANTENQLGGGKGPYTASATPVPVYMRKTDGEWMELRGVSAIAAGSAHTCAITRGGVRCWGWNGNGQLGNGNQSFVGSGTAVSVIGHGPLSGVTATTLGIYHGCLLVNDAVRCWGWNIDGQLGNPYVQPSYRPIDVLDQFYNFPLTGVLAIEAGGYQTCAIVGPTRGALCWGADAFGSLGDGGGRPTRTRRPVAVSDLSDVEALSGFYYHICALQSSGRIRCWGYNSRGQLGNGTTISADTPADVSQEDL